MVDGEVITASQHRSSGRLKVTGDAPDEVMHFARTIAARDQPAPVFVLDVGEVDEIARRVTAWRRKA